MIHEAKEEFQGILGYLESEAQRKQLHEVEKEIFTQMLHLGRTLLEVFLKIKGDGNVGKTHTDSLGIVRNLHSSKREKVYHSIFGKVVIKRANYWSKNVHSLCPLDAMLNLPEKSYSHLLAQWSTMLGSREAYKKAAEVLQEILGLKIYNEAIKSMVQQSSTDVEKYYQQLPAPKQDDEGEILVATVDCKGVPIIKDKPAVKKHKRKKGEKPGKKKMSTVSALYTIDRYRRNIDDVIKEVSETHNSLEKQRDPLGPESNPKRPKPKNKNVRATMAGKDVAFGKLLDEVNKRDNENVKAKVFLIDGELKLRELASSFPGFCIIRDLYHVLQYLWRASYVFCEEGSDEAQNWVSSRLRLLLQGKVACIISSLEYEKQNRKLTKSKLDSLSSVITYLRNGQQYMKYDFYLAHGYPIGSGVIEGACRSLVKDRFELAGMKWRISGADALLKMRSLDLNRQLDSFWHFRAQREFSRLYDEYLIPCHSCKITA